MAAYAYRAAGALVRAGADPDRALPDGTTPLLRAVESGSSAVVDALLWSQFLPKPEERLPEAERVRLLDAARRWYGAGAEAELRRLTGAVGPAETALVEEEWCEVEEFTLGGRTVRGGHGAVLTTLERVFGVPVSPGELVARAVRHPDPSHVDWSASLYGLDGARETVTPLWDHPSREHRLFAADWLYSRQFGIRVDEYPTHGEDRELLAAWADGEPDPEVLALVLLALFQHEVEHPRLGALGLRYTSHPDPRVRVAAVQCLGVPPPGTARTALRVLAGDPDHVVRLTAVEHLLPTGEDPDALRAVVRDLARDPLSPVRHAAADSLAESADRTTGTTELLLSLLDADDRLTRMIGAYGLALRDHPDTPRAYARVEELGRLSSPDHRALEFERWRERNEPDRWGTGTSYPDGTE